MSRNRSVALRHALLTGISLVASASFAAPAMAQSADEENASASGDIIVTARRTEEKLSDVPVSVAAISADALEKQRILTEADLQQSVPGLTVRQTSTSNQTSFSLRGQSLDAFSFASPAVLSYFNEVNVQGVSAAAFFDLDSIQVVKGPQGTLFGRNATGGAVLLQSRKPSTREVAGYAKASYGRFNDVVLEGAVNLPLGEGAAFRVAGQYQTRDGYQRNLLLGTRNGSLDNKTVRASLLVEPVGSSFSNVLVGQYGKYGGNSAGLKAQTIYTPGQVRTDSFSTLDPAIPSALLYGNTPAFGGNPVSRDPRVNALFANIFDFQNKQRNVGFYDIYNNTDGNHDARQYLVTDTATVELSDSLKLKNVIGYNDVRTADRTDIDGTPYQPLAIDNTPTTAQYDGYIYENKQFSEELQLSGDLSDKANFLIGAYYFYGFDAQRIPLSVAPDLFFGPLGVFLRTYQIKSYSKAGYAQVGYKLTDRLNLTAGARYTWELTKYAPRTGDASAAAGVLPESLKASKPSWSVSLDYKLTDDLLVYVAHRGSWRTGGFNGTAAIFDPAVNRLRVNRFLPETTYDFEAGLKYSGRIGGVTPARFNIAVFDQYVKNVIRAVYIGVSANSGNAAKARITGVEADASITPVPWLELGGNLSYTNARFTDGRGNVAGQNFVFGPMGDVPKWNGSVYFRASTDLSNDMGELALRGDYYEQSKFFYSNANSSILPGTSIKGYHVANARIEWNRISGSGFSVAGYVRNLTDEKYNVGGFPLGAVLGINAVLPGTPRQYGIEASVKF